MPPEISRFRPLIGGDDSTEHRSSGTPTRGPAGTAFTIKGTYLGGATKVTFNGVWGAIHQDTGTKIKVKVPSGATTGKIKVVTAGEKVTSTEVSTMT